MTSQLGHDHPGAQEEVLLVDGAEAELGLASLVEGLFVPARQLEVVALVQLGRLGHVAV